MPEEMELEWFPCYTQQWQDSESVRFMSLAAQGAYWQLICWQFRKGSIPASRREQARAISCDTSELEAVWPELEGKFEDDGNGRLINPQMKIIRDEQIAKMNASALKAQAAANARWNAPSNTASNADAKPQASANEMHEQCSEHNSSNASLMQIKNRELRIEIKNKTEIKKERSEGECEEKRDAAPLENFSASPPPPDLILIPDPWWDELDPETLESRFMASLMQIPKFAKHPPCHESVEKMLDAIRSFAPNDEAISFEFPRWIDFNQDNATKGGRKDGVAGFRSWCGNKQESWSGMRANLARLQNTKSYTNGKPVYDPKAVYDWGREEFEKQERAAL